MEVTYTIEDIHKEDFLRQVEIEKIYNLILRNICSDIRMAHVKFRKDYIVYHIPIGFPGHVDYDFSACSVFIINKLRKSGLYVRFRKPNNLYISWLNKDLRQQRINDYKRLLLENEMTKKIMHDNGINLRNGIGWKKDVKKITYKSLK